MATNCTHVRHSIGGVLPREGFYTLTLGPTGYRLFNMSEGFGPARDPEPLGTILFALALQVTFDPDDGVLSGFASAVKRWASALERLEQRSSLVPEVELSSDSVSAWAEAAMMLCPSAEVAERVCQQVHWLLDPIANQIEARRKAMLEASDWLSVCFKRAQSFADNAKSIEGRGEHHSAVVARYLGAYHLLRGGGTAVPGADK